MDGNPIYFTDPLGLKAGKIAEPPTIPGTEGQEAYGTKGPIRDETKTKFQYSEKNKGWMEIHPDIVSVTPKNNSQLIRLNQFANAANAVRSATAVVRNKGSNGEGKIDITKFDRDAVSFMAGTAATAAEEASNITVANEQARAAYVKKNFKGKLNNTGKIAKATKFGTAAKWAGRGLFFTGVLFGITDLFQNPTLENAGWFLLDVGVSGVSTFGIGTSGGTAAPFIIMGANAYFAERLYQQYGTEYE